MLDFLFIHPSHGFSFDASLHAHSYVARGRFVATSAFHVCVTHELRLPQRAFTQAIPQEFDNRRLVLTDSGPMFVGQKVFGSTQDIVTLHRKVQANGSQLFDDLHQNTSASTSFCAKGASPEAQVALSFVPAIFLGCDSLSSQGAQVARSGVSGVASAALISEEAHL
jgi:hypothetical protein